MRIREYRNSDYAVLAEALQAEDLFSYEYDSEEKLEEKARRRSGFVLVAESEDGSFIGSIGGLLREGEGDERPSIFRLVVLPGQRKKGVGSALLKEAEKRLGDLGADSLEIFIDSENQELKNWYLKRGYKEEGTKDVGKITHCVLRKFL
ncbi:MAG: GNAT family N-acetyltransferase [bacterium]|nr:GNAT family N-acetyltransferase [bacterium]